ncbi:MAG: DUF1800 domain-containing protein, partial [Planctomycetota bacterium]
MSMTPLLTALLALAPLGQDIEPFEFDARAAEHLLSRAGFGATTDEVEAAVEAGLDATVERLLEGGDRVRDPFWAERLSPKNMSRDERLSEARERRGAGMNLRGMDEEQRREMLRDYVTDQRRDDERQLRSYTDWWIDSMLEGEDPLRDRMALFWHGYFTSSQTDVRDSYELILQAEHLREHALGSFRELLWGVAKSPAMLEYLDNDDNQAGEPNENFARELLEMFTLGEGHYTEADVLEAARAFTGWTDRRGEFRFRRSRHDSSEKTILGQTGRHDGADVLDILLAHQRTPVHVAERLLTYLEGRDPSPERAERYGRILRTNDMVLAPMLEALFKDPAFYREAIVGQRIASPIDLLVGLARRLRVDPPPLLVSRGADLLGEKLFYPPNVSGWDGEEAWITTAMFMRRGNLAGVLLGEVSLAELISPDAPLPGFEPEMDDDGPRIDRNLRDLSRIQRLG